MSVPAAYNRISNTSTEFCVPRIAEITHSQILSQKIFGKKSSEHVRNSKKKHGNPNKDQDKAQKMLHFEGTACSFTECMGIFYTARGIGSGIDESKHKLSNVAETGRYIAESLGDVLRACLNELCQHRPLDPIEYIAEWLYCYADSKLYLDEKAAFLKRSIEMAQQLRKERRQRLERMKQLRIDAYGCRSMTSYVFADDDDDELIRKLMASLETTETGGTADPNKQDLSFLFGRLSRIQSTFGVNAKKEALQSRASKMQDTEGSVSQASKRRTGHRGEDSSSDEDDSYDSSDDDEYGSGQNRRKSRRWSRDYDSRENVERSSSSARNLRKRRRSSMFSGQRKEKGVKWVYEDPPGRIVCIHPLLGRLTRPMPSTTQEQRLESMWLAYPFSCLSLYQHELYACLPDSMLYCSPIYEGEDEDFIEEDITPIATVEFAIEQQGDEDEQRRKEEKRRREEEKRREIEREKMAREAAEEDDDPRWKSCPDDDTVCESWKICEGFKQDTSRPPSPTA